MKLSSIFNFKKPEASDDILESIDGISENFEKIDKLIIERTNSLTNFLKTGDSYERSKLIYNSAPVIGGAVGWINVRTGKYAPTWQERTIYNLGDIVISSVNNGHIYECVENGISGVSEPTFPTATNSAVFDKKNSAIWIPNRVYKVDDIVTATNGSELYYYRCTIAGTSGTTEPDWTQVAGTSISDGSARWQVYKTVKWKEVGVSCSFRDFGTIL